MARDDTARSSESEASLLDRRSYLKLAGAAAATVASTGTGMAATGGQSMLLEEDFSTSGYADYFTHTWRQGTHDQRVSGTSYSGDNSLLLDMPEGSHYGIAATVDPVKAGLVDNQLDEMYVSYWVRFSNDFSATSAGHKIPGIGNTEDQTGKGGTPATGTGWSARGLFTERDGALRVGMYVYHMDMDGSYGDNFMAGPIERGKWHRVEQHVKLNSVDSNGNANRDGVLKMWLNGQKRVEKTDLRWTNHPDEFGCNHKFVVRHGGNSPSPKDQTVHIDNWRINDAVPSKDSSSSTTQGKVLELVSNDSVTGGTYQFTVDGSVSKRTSAGNVSADGNDSITDNGDGTVTVSGTSGSGYGDSYLVDGTVTSMQIDESNWTIRYDGTEVSVAELTSSDQQSSGSPTLERFEVSKSSELGQDVMFSVKWAAADSNSDLDVVEVVVNDGASDVNFSVQDVSGASASGWELFQFPVGSNLNVTLRAEDSNGNVTKDSTSITL